jgi:hypothetical protein
VGVAAQAVGLTLLLLTSFSRSQENFPPLAQNAKWDINLWMAGATGEENLNSFTEAQIWTAGVSGSRMITSRAGERWLQGNLEYGVNLVPVLVQSGSASAYGGGFEPVVLRWNSGRHLGRAVPYIELAGGGIFTNTNLPQGDTSNFNFTTRGGGGIQFFTGRRQSFDLACRYYHISNANLGVRNPEFNGVQISVLYHWFK